MGGPVLDWDIRHRAVRLCPHDGLGGFLRLVIGLNVAVLGMMGGWGGILQRHDILFTGT